MAIDPTDYLPHGMIMVLGTVAAWVFRDHAKADDRRFDKFGEAYMDLSKKLDTAISKQSENHTEILKILLDQKHV
jgi:hypothetical protein